MEYALQDDKSWTHVDGKCKRPPDMQVDENRKDDPKFGRKYGNVEKKGQILKKIY